MTILPDTPAAPESIPVVTAIALAVSILGFTIAAISLIWQIVRHYRDTGRVKVRLDHVIWAPLGGTVSHDRGAYALPQLAATARERGWKIPMSYLELARITVENPGSTAVSVIGPQLQLGGTGVRSHSITTSRFDLEDPMTVPRSKDLASRVEPFDVVEFYFDFKSGLEALAKEHPKLSVRAQVRVAGKSRPALSSRKLRWHIEPEGQSVREDGKQDAETIIFQAIVSTKSIWLTDEAPAPSLIAEVARILSGRLQSKVGNLAEISDDIRKVLDELHGKTYGIQIASAFFAVNQALEEHAERIYWPPQGAPAYQLPSEWESRVREDPLSRSDKVTSAENTPPPD